MAPAAPTTTSTTSSSSSSHPSAAAAAAAAAGGGRGGFKVNTASFGQQNTAGGNSSYQHDTTSSSLRPTKHRHSSSLPSSPLSHALGRGRGRGRGSSGDAHRHHPAQFHRRGGSHAVPLPKPSHKPPSTFHTFQGDIHSQDIFVEAIRKRNEKIKILFPGSDRFEMQRNDVWNHDVVCTPSLILEPKSEREVSDCLKAYSEGVHKCLSANKRQKASFAIPRLCVAGGKNSINCMREGSIVIDLCRMRSVKLDLDSQTVKVQGGARIIDVDAVLGEYGLVVPLGTSQHLGVVGCILGGGLGFASRKYGLSCDNVVAASIILADGRLKNCTMDDQHKELLWGICGGGGGLGIVVSVTLKCYPLRHAALLTFDMPTVDIQQKRDLVRFWMNWINGDVDNENPVGGRVIAPNLKPAPKEVFSQLVIPTNSNSISFLGTSIDTSVISQTDGFIEMYTSAERKQKKRGGFLKQFLAPGNQGAFSDQNIPHGWQEIPGLSDLIDDKFGVPTRKRLQFRMLRYSDQLQSISNEYFSPGNIFSSIKYAKTITNTILEVLIHATTGEISPKNESKIVIMSMNGSISENKSAGKRASFSSRNMHYMIYIEGKWDAYADHKLDKEKDKVKRWVHWVVNKLHLCEGIRSGVHPESMLDMVSKSGKSKPPMGWYNFNEHSGRKLNILKYQRDPRNVFSFASRVSWSRSLSEKFDDSLDDKTTSTDMKDVEFVKDGEAQPADCLKQQKVSVQPFWKIING
jgi:FAD/FMN-containing dehydrogenases